MTTVVKTLPLTRREQEVLVLVREGLTSKQIGDILLIHKRTIEFHLDNIYPKLHVTNRIGALRVCARLNLLPEEETNADAD